MNFHRKFGAILIIVILIIVAGVLAVGSGTPKEGSKNSIEVSNAPSQASVQPASVKFEKELKPLVEEGYLDNVVKDSVLAAVEKYESDLKDKVNTDDTAANKNESLTLTVLKSKGYVSEEIFNLVKTAVDESKAAKKEVKFRPLVAAGLFADTASAEIMYKAFNKQLGAKTVAQKEIVMKEIESAVPPLTESEKKQKKDEFNASREKRIDEVLATMVSANEISVAQSDALKLFITTN